MRSAELQDAQEAGEKELLGKCPLTGENSGFADCRYHNIAQENRERLRTNCKNAFFFIGEENVPHIDNLGDLVQFLSELHSDERMLAWTEQDVNYLSHRSTVSVTLPNRP
eukprot:TRINITY_DN13952_c0_g1_i3.p2 TRINITY_DN13952_c0_g1~~TRINITY_DN13952_c0_g1_i3.p2  ORF type:complete len:110 (-),score=3.22 TRINITY_DN13952_c0_g1_i3:116-445(-)